MGNLIVHTISSFHTTSITLTIQYKGEEGFTDLWPFWRRVWRWSYMLTGHFHWWVLPCCVHELHSISKRASEGFSQHYVEAFLPCWQSIHWFTKIVELELWTKRQELAIFREINSHHLSDEPPLTGVHQKIQNSWEGNFPSEGIVWLTMDAPAVRVGEELGWWECFLEKHGHRIPTIYKRGAKHSHLGFSPLSSSLNSSEWLGEPCWHS